MGLRINDIIPNLTVETDQGTFALHDWIGDHCLKIFITHDITIDLFDNNSLTNIISLSIFTYR